MAGSMVLFSMMHGTVRLLSDDIHPFEIAFFRNLFGVLTVAPWFIRYGWEPLRTKRLSLHLQRGVLNVVAMLMFFSALSLSPIALVQALAFTSPLFATVLAILFLKERVGARRWTAICVGFLGTLIIIRPGVQDIDLGAMLTVGSAAIWAACLIMIKRLSDTDSAVTITTYMVVVMTPLTGIAAAFVWVTPTWEQLGWLCACGVWGTLAQLITTKSLSMAAASFVLPLDFTKIIWGALIGYVAFGEVVDGWTWGGAIIIFVGATYITLRERKLAAQKN